MGARIEQYSLVLFQVDLPFVEKQWFKNAKLKMNERQKSENYTFE